MYTRSLSHLILLLLLVKHPSALGGKMEGFVVGGNFVNIKRYPHLAFLDIACKVQTTKYHRCGSSIINQHFTLTAAHCMSDCDPWSSHIGIIVGHEDLRKGLKSSAKSFKIHSRFDPEEAMADIGLVQLKTPMDLNTNVRRVALTTRIYVPHDAIGFVAGWGFVDDIKKKYSWKLKHVNQTLWSRASCEKILGRDLIRGTFCAGTLRGKDYAADGDSGNALIIKNYVQIGIVSHKVMTVSRSLVIYTNVGYYYDWIKGHTLSMHCS